MRTLRILAVLLPIFTLLSVHSQDIHWSQINQLQSFQNPANIGEFQDDIKFTLAIKDQWRSVTKPYQTFFGNIDTKLRKINNLSLACNFVSDITGDGNFKTNQINVISKYEILKLKKLHFSIGVDIGMVNKTLQFSNFKYDNQFDGYKYNETYNSNENFNTNSSTNYTIGLGSLSKYQIKRNSSVILGYGIYNVNQPKESFYQLNIVRPIRHHLFSTYNINFSKYSISTSINYNHQYVYNELLIGSLLSLKTKNIKIPFLFSGLYYRFSDAIILNLGATINKFKCIFSYDINISKLNKASNGRGSLEMTIQYLLRKQNIKLPIQQKCLDYY